MNLEPRLKLFLYLSAVFIVCLILGDLIGGKLFELTVGKIPFVISVGMLPFPITFLLTDLINEFYGARWARFVTLVGFFMAVLTYAIVLVAVRVPWAPFTLEPGWGGINRASFDNVFSGSQRMMIASMAAYLFAQFTDIAVFHAIKRLTKDRFLWLRATGSTIVSQLIDTVVIQSIAWVGLLRADKLVSIILTSYAVKVVIAIALTPLIYAGHELVERQFQMKPMAIEQDL